MANPRRNSNPTSETPQSQTLSSLVFFLKRPHAFPFLLSIFILLTWVSLRFQHPQLHYPSSQTQSTDLKKWTKEADDRANLVRFGFDHHIFRDNRGWLLNPVTAANEAGILGGAQSCASVHAGQIRPGGVRGNHRHHTCNETFIIWGAKTKFRLENSQVLKKGYAEVMIGAQDVAIAASPSGTAHALVNVDPMQSTFFLGCQDGIILNSSTTDYNVWKDL